MSEVSELKIMASLLQPIIISFQYAVIGLIAWLSIVIVYRWLFHPLAKLPGPFLAKMTDCYNSYFLFKGNLHIRQLQLHQAYGRIVRIGPNRLLFETPTALHEIDTSRGLRKSKGYAAQDPVPGFPNVFTATDKNVHRLKRKALSGGFSDQFIKRFENEIIENADIFVEQLLPQSDGGRTGGWSEAYNMSDKCKYFTLDVMGVFGFGRSFNLQREEANRDIFLGIRAGVIISGIHANFPELRRLNLHKRIKAKGAWTQARFGGFCREMITQRMKSDRDARPDLFSFAIEAKDEETGDVFKLDDIWAESRFFMIAGVFFYLSRFPSCAEKLTAEVRRTFSWSDDIRLGPELSSCHYLRAVIDESLRLSPPVANALWREVSEPGQMVDGTPLPIGTEVGVSIYSILHSEKTYPNASVFIPERWLEPSAGGKFPGRLAEAKNAVKPFSLGSRSCAGMNLAYAEMTILVAKTVWAVDFKRPDGPLAHVGAGSTGGPPGRRVVDEFQMRSFITSLHDGPYLQCRPRASTR